MKKSPRDYHEPQKRKEDNAIKRDLLRSAQRQYAQGEREERNKEYSKATASFRLSAALYSTVIAHCVEQRNEAEQIRRLYEDWSAQFGCKTKPIWHGAGPIPPEHDFAQYVLNTLMEDRSMDRTLVYLQEGLLLRGFNISSPGNSLERHLITMLKAAFNNIRNSRYTAIIEDPDIRVPFELLVARMLTAWRQERKQ